MRFHYINLVTGHELQMTNPDSSRTYVGIYLHENRLYIFDATVAKGTPPPLIFQQTPAFLDAEARTSATRTYYYKQAALRTKLGPGRPWRRWGGSVSHRRNQASAAVVDAAARRKAHPQQRRDRTFSRRRA
jgi:hypothetical protein